MPLLRINYRSDWVGRKDVAVLYPRRAPSPGYGQSPAPRERAGNARYPVLYLIHGSGGDFTDWPLRAMALDACERAGLFVVMPTVQDFLSARLELGDFYACVARELPEFMCNMFPVSQSREDTFIAGLSFGGYFAYRVALNNPERFSRVGSFASPLDVVSDVRDRHLCEDGFPTPEALAGSDKDLLYAAGRLARSATAKPALFQACGTEDFTWNYNVTARDALRALGYDHTWVEMPGAHTFSFFDAALRRFVDWLPLTRRQNRED